jgi:hypothetical protein
MRVPCKALLVLGITLLNGHVATGQNFDPSTYYFGFSALLSADANTLTISVPRTAQRFPLVQGAPFSGEVGEQMARSENEMAQKRQNVQRTRIWRDFEGRIRVERRAFPGLEAAAQGYPAIVTICDPVARSIYVLDLQHRIAHRLPYGPFPAPPPNQSARPAPAPRAQPKAARDPMLPSRKVESLEQQMIEGTVAEGSRMTVTYPKGYEGNDRPIVVISEVWLSQELQLIVLSKHNDPHTGVHVREVTNISKRVPDAALFQVPGDFAIVDESGAFQFTLTRNGS